MNGLRGRRGGACVFGILRREQLEHPLVLHVAGGRDDDVVVGVNTPVVGRESLARDRRDHRGAPDHGPAEWMASEDRCRDDVVNEILRVVVDHRDLFEHDLALGVDLGEHRVVDHADDHVERRLEPVVGDARVERASSPARWRR